MAGHCRRGLLIILSSPSGAGKTTLARRLTSWDSSIEFSVSATTRPPRPGEQQGREYCFCTPEQFSQLQTKGNLLESASVFGHLYGSPRAPVEAAIESSHDIVFDIDWQGGAQIAASTFAKDTVTIFILPPSIGELRRRLELRGKDSSHSVDLRMCKAKDEIRHWSDYSYVLINNDIDETFETIKSIVIAERMRQERQREISGFVQELLDEFRTEKK
ncbi:MAG: guanylate kinase [Rhodobacteraceae bacterium]|nr:guanylate kinase [Paracoccaceae bacterium]MCY4197837.1 guanylate kinase [Paracoccaceae bacterium]